MIGAVSRKLDRLLDRRGQTCWAFITAWNPGSVALEDKANAARQHTLLRYLERGGYTWLPGRGVGQDSAWTPEESLLVFGMDSDAAVKAGKRFGQLAVVAGKRGAPARLISCSEFA